METKKAKKPLAPRVDMPCQPAEVRRSNFKEVALGYTREMAMEEASRCLQCKKPLCVSGCPVEVPIRDFIGEVARGNMDAAYRIIKSTNSLPAVCGRVCPQENQCEGKCILKAKGQPIAIGRLERFVADTYIATTACEQVTGTNACAVPQCGKKVACIGSGPSSLTCAGVCAAAGIKVDVFEALHEPGGVLIYDPNGVVRPPQRKDIRVYAIPATEEAARLGNIRVFNTMILGGYLKVKPVVSLDNVFRGLAKSLPERMASLIPANEAAIQKGMEIIRVPEMVA